MNKNYKKDLDKNLSLLGKLLAVEPIDIEYIFKVKPEAMMVPGIYGISLPDDSEIVYVGKTRTNTIYRRILDHRSITTNSDLKGMLKNNPDMEQKIEKYKVRYLKIDDERDRGFAEYFCIGCLRPKLNK